MLLQLGGVVAIAAGAGVLYWPAGLIVGGVAAVAVGTVAEMSEGSSS